jgi:hypothetical protein
MNTCQYCGTELNSKRAKNCPVCAGILNDANRKGAYSFVIDAAVTAKYDGLIGAEVHQTMQGALKAGQAKQAEWAAEYRRRIEERKQADSRRVKFYQDHGYWPGQLAEDEIDPNEAVRPDGAQEPEIYG